MMLSLLRSLTSVVYSILRRRAVTLSQEKEPTYAQTFNISDLKAVYHLNVAEIGFTVDYGYWWLPNLRNRIYRATMQVYIDGVPQEIYEQWYPKLNRSGFTDPLYPLSIIASTHIERYMSQENLNGFDL